MNSKEVLYSKGQNDEVYTPRYAVLPIVKHLEKFKGKIIWCPFDTEKSEFVKVFQENGFKVEFSHQWENKDYYKYQPKKWDLMISNPPFTGKRQIFERALSFNKPFALIMTNTWLNDSAPKQLFAEKDLQLLMFDKRIEYNGNNKITFSSSYFCWNFLSKQIVMETLIKDKKYKEKI